MGFPMKEASILYSLSVAHQSDGWKNRGGRNAVGFGGLEVYLVMRAERNRLAGRRVCMYRTPWTPPANPAELGAIMYERTKKMP